MCDFVSFLVALDDERVLLGDPTSHGVTARLWGLAPDTYREGEWTERDEFPVVRTHPDDKKDGKWLRASVLTQYRTREALIGACRHIVGPNFDLHHNADGRRHNPDGPAHVERNDAGVVMREGWYVDGQPHNPDGPAHVERNDAGVVTSEEWYVDGQLHNPDGPAHVVHNDACVVTFEEWYVDGRLHNPDGPAHVERNDAGVVTYEEWYVDGRRQAKGETDD